MMPHPHLSASELDGHLRHTLPIGEDHQVRIHLEQCRACWRQWNHHLWDAAQGSPLLALLAEFLGSGFQPHLDPRVGLRLEWEAAGQISGEWDEVRFCRTSVTYLYHEVVTEASGYRQDNVGRILPTLARHGVQTAIDYGCGVGRDTVMLHANGFAVAGCDFASPATGFLGRRCDQIPLVEPDQLRYLPTPDLLWITDLLGGPVHH